MRCFLIHHKDLQKLHLQLEFAHNDYGGILIMNQPKSIIGCEFSEAYINNRNEPMINICYMRDGIDEDEILHFDLVFFCCYIIRQLVNLQTIKPIYANELAKCLREVTPTNFDFEVTNWTQYSFEGNGRRLMAVLELGVGSNFRCQADGFWWFKDKALFSGRSSLVLLKYLIDELGGIKRAKKIAYAANLCADYYSLGGSDLYGEFTVQNQWDIALGVAEQIDSYKDTEDLLAEIKAYSKAQSNS